MLHKIISLSSTLGLNVLMALWLVSCTTTAHTNFEYRGIYSPTNSSAEFQQANHTNHVDCDWDLWGHNMGKVVGANPDKRVYATVADTLCKQQFCFSSDVLYKKTVEYILDQFGEGNDQYAARICIMPQDNRIACTCSKCRALGNTEGNATPAVTQMLTRLAKRFPRHQFFTSAYHTTMQVPSKKLPSNVGVLVSASRFQLRVDFSNAKGYKEFVDLVNAWRSVTSTIYVWDYARNFNDYLTPFPCLHVMQSRFRLYSELGVKGIFINGSGYDYSSFDDVQTAVLAQLMEDPDTDVDKAVAKYFSDNYPVTADLLTEYYLGLEHRTVETNHHLPIYSESMEEVTTSYLLPEEFAEWRARLDKASKLAERPERMRLNYLLTALSFTQLQLYRHHLIPADEDMEAEMKAILQGHSEIKEMQYYSEDGGSIDEYLRNK